MGHLFFSFSGSHLLWLRLVLSSQGVFPRSAEQSAAHPPSPAVNGPEVAE